MVMFPFALSSSPPPLPAPDASVTAIVKRARAGDHAAFTALFDQYNAPICRYLAHLVGNDEVGRDLAQETFFLAWRALPGIRDESRFGPWLYRIASNLAYSHLRHARLTRWLPWADPGSPRQLIRSPSPVQKRRLARRSTSPWPWQSLRPNIVPACCCRSKRASASARLPISCM